MSTAFLKDPDSVLDYIVDWSKWLPSGDTSAAVAWDVPTGIVESTEGRSNTVSSATIWLSSGTVGNTYDIGCRITTASTRIAERTMRVKVQER